MRSLAALLVLLLSASVAQAQSITVAWDPIVDLIWTVPEFRVYRDGAPVGATSALQFSVPVTPGVTHALQVSSYGWKLDENLNTVWAEGDKSPAISYTEPLPPPPPPEELCGSDGFGNGLDDDGDGLIDERPPCLEPPPLPPPPSGCLTGGTLAPIGSTLTHTMKNGEADPFILARRAEGWTLLSRRKVKNLTTVMMECRGL